MGNYLYNFIVTKKQGKNRNRYIPISKSKEGFRMAQPKRRWSKARTHKKDQHGKKKIQHYQVVHIVMNQ